VYKPDFLADPLKEWTVKFRWGGRGAARLGNLWEEKEENENQCKSFVICLEFFDCGIFQKKVQFQDLKL